MVEQKFLVFVEERLALCRVHDVCLNLPLKFRRSWKPGSSRADHTILFYGITQWILAFSLPTGIRRSATSSFPRDVSGEHEPGHGLGSWPS